MPNDYEQMNIRLTTEQYEQLRRCAVSEERSMAATIRRAIRLYASGVTTPRVKEGS